MPSIWPFVPESGATETFEYNTEVLKTYTKEQRIRLRDQPRYILKYTFFLDDEQLAYAKAIAKLENQTGSYKVPVWQEALKYSGTISAGTTTITINTNQHKFSGTELILWKDWDSYEIVPILSKTATTITLSSAVVSSVVDPFIVPVKTMRVYNAFETSTGAPNINYMSVTFTSITHKNYIKESENIFDLVDLFDTYDIFIYNYPKYKGSTVYINPPFRFNDVSTQIVRPVELVDNGFGPVAVEPIFITTEERFVMDFFYQGLQQRVDILGLLCESYGKLKNFWLPSFTKDVLLSSGTYSTNTLTVLGLGSASDYIGKSLFIKQLDGSYQCNTVTNAVVAGANFILTLETNLTSPVSNSLTEFVSFMKLSRFDTDSFDITTGAASSGKVTLNSIEVPN